MAEAIVQDWLSEYESIDNEAELKTFASVHELNPEVADAIHTILNERIKYFDLIHSICNQFHSFYRSTEEKLRKFSLQFIPILIYIYLNSIAMGDKKNCRSVETLLISIYNIEVSTDDGQQKIVSFRMPVLAQASIYHEEKSTLHATDLRRWEENINRDVKWGPLQQIELINVQNRMKVMTALLFAYNQQLSFIQKAGLLYLCRIASQIVNQGFSKSGHVHRLSYGNDPSNITSPSALPSKILPRIALTSSFLIELVHSIYFAMFNDFGTIAIQTLENIHQRGSYEMFADLILVTNAVKHSLHANPSGQPNDGPMGLSVALTPATTTVIVSKSMITNASFRTKKLPDDIPIQDEIASATGVPLTSISEEDSNEKPQIGSRNSCIRSSKESTVGGIKAQAQKALIAGFKKVKDKEKEKDKEKDIFNNKNASSTIKIGNIDLSDNGMNINAVIGVHDPENIFKHTIIPPKVPVRKEKRLSVQINDLHDHMEKSPSLLLQGKSSNSTIKHNQFHNDSKMVSGAVNNKSEVIQMQIITNGTMNYVVANDITDNSLVNSEQKFDSIDTNYSDISGSGESINEICLNMPNEVTRPSIAALINSNLLDQTHQEHEQQQFLQKPRIQSEV